MTILYYPETLEIGCERGRGLSGGDWHWGDGWPTAMSSAQGATKREERENKDQCLQELLGVVAVDVGGQPAT